MLGENQIPKGPSRYRVSRHVGIWYYMGRKGVPVFTYCAAKVCAECLHEPSFLASCNLLNPKPGGWERRCGSFQPQLALSSNPSKMIR